MVLLLPQALLRKGLDGQVANMASPRCPGVLQRVPAAQVGHSLFFLSLRGTVLDGTQGVPCLTDLSPTESFVRDRPRPDEEHST